MKQHDGIRMGRIYNQQSTFLSDDLDHDMHLQGGLFRTGDDIAEEHLLMFALEQFTAVEDLVRLGILPGTIFQIIQNKSVSTY